MTQHTTATDTVKEVTTAIDQKGSLMPWRKNDGWVGEDYNPVNQNGWIDSAKDLFNLPETQPRDWQETDSIVEGHRIAIGRDYQSGRTEYELNLSRLRGGEDVEKEIHPDASLVTLITHTTTK
jgi:hypothetical protein